MQKLDVDVSPREAEAVKTRLSPQPKIAAAPDDVTNMSPNSESSTKENSCINRVKVSNTDSRILISPSLIGA